ncbi:FAD-binding protein [Chloroflexota bacterium]
MRWSRLMQVLIRQVDARGIKVMLEVSAQELIQNEQGDIIGVIVESGGKDVSIKANKGVIMTCGGL